MQPNKTLATIAAISLAAGAAHAATSIVYSNATAFSGFVLNPGANEVADEIILGAGDRFGYLFRFEYYGTNFSGNETVQLRFYQNDGAFIGNNTYLPNTVFYDSGTNSLTEPTDPSGRATLQYDLTYTPIALPERFTFSVSFGGIEANEIAALAIYNPFTVGQSENDYWFNTGSAWELRGTNGVAINFGASMVATSVPEPSTYALAILGGLCGLALVNRRKRKA